MSQINHNDGNTRWLRKHGGEWWVIFLIKFAIHTHLKLLIETLIFVSLFLGIMHIARIKSKHAVLLRVVASVAN